MPEVAENRRLSILQAVVALMTSGGADLITLRLVAKKAGVSLGLVSYHFHSRATLFRAALDWVLDEIGRVGAGIAPSEKPADILAAFFLLEELLLTKRVDLLSAWFSFVTLGRTDRRIAARVQEHYVDRVENARDFLKEAMAAGQIRPDLRPGLTAEDLVASVEGMGLLWLNRNDPKGIAAHRQRAVRRWTKTLGLT